MLASLSLEGKRIVKRPKRSRMVIPIAHPSQADPVPIVADGIIATKGLAQGRHIPVLILDTSDRQDIEMLVQAHQDREPGDAVCYWTIKKRPLAPDAPHLLLKMTKPSKCIVIVEFDMTKNQGFLVDQILRARGFYLQPGRLGDRLSTAFESPRILVEIPPNRDFEVPFHLLYEKAVYQRLRKEGMSRAQARRTVRSFLKKSRGLFRKPFQS